VIEDEVIVGAGCMVPPRKTLENSYVYAGIPYKRLQPGTENEKQFFRYSLANYLKLKDQYLTEQVTQLA